MIKKRLFYHRLLVLCDYSLLMQNLEFLINLYAVVNLVATTTINMQVMAINIQFKMDLFIILIVVVAAAALVINFHFITTTTTTTTTIEFAMINY
jgi:hypothetical protein